METGNLHESFSADDIAKYRSANVEVDWSDPTLGKIVRLRLVSDPDFPFWDFSYCWGALKDGTPCRVRVPFFQLSKRTLKADIIRDAQRDKVFAKGLGIFDALSLCQ